LPDDAILDRKQRRKGVAGIRGTIARRNVRDFGQFFPIAPMNEIDGPCQSDKNPVRSRGIVRSLVLDEY
jgi:hypothetical protein